MNNIKKQTTILLAIELFLVSLLFKGYPLMNNILTIISIIILGKTVLNILIKSIKDKQIYNYNNTIIIPLIIILLIEKDLAQLNILLIFYTAITLIIDNKNKNNLYKKIISTKTIITLRKNNIKEININKIKKNTYLEILKNQLIPFNCILVSDKAFIKDNFLNNNKISTKEKDNRINFLSTNIGDKITVEVTEDYKDSSYKELYDSILEYDRNLKKIMTFSKVYSIIVKFIVSMYIIIPILTESYIEKEYLKDIMILLLISDNKLILTFIQNLYINYFNYQLKNKILVSKINVINKISKIKNLIFRKKGIITENILTIDKVVTKDYDKFFYYLLHGEFNCDNDIAITIKNYYDQKINKKIIKNYTFTEGLGIKVKIEGKNVLIGNSYYMQENNIPINKIKKVATIIYLVVDNELLGHIEISDKIRKNVIEDIKNFNKNSNIKTIIFSGDNERIVNAISSELNIKEKYSNLQEKDKIFWLNYINENSKGLTGYIGDIEKDKNIIENVDISFGYYKNKNDLKKYDIILLENRLNKIKQLFIASKKYSIGIKTNILTYILLKIFLFILYLIDIKNIFIYLTIEIVYFILIILIKLIIKRRSKYE
ncbi:MAG: hypothetical protein PHQ64_01750 [Bacilli bacterium]|nr:hypothetical protein [Bacilli bacterium]